LPARYFRLGLSGSLDRREPGPTHHVCSPPASNGLPRFGRHRSPNRSRDADLRLVLELCDLFPQGIDATLNPEELGHRVHVQFMSFTQPQSSLPLRYRLATSSHHRLLEVSDPLTGVDELVIEASWGLGESVVGGLVTPDSYRIGQDGSVRDRRLGRKSVSIAPVNGGGTEEQDVDPTRARDPCLDDEGLRALWGLASQCQEVFGVSPLDIEWAFGGGRLHLLQCRPVTVR